MKTTQTTLIVLLAISVAACSTTRKSTAPATAAAPTENTVLRTKPGDGIYAPGSEELAAIQLQFKATTMAQLQEGYILYTKGACISCHGAMSIYQYSETAWKTIIASMAPRARISETQKESLYQYVLAIKATQYK